MAEYISRHASGAVVDDLLDKAQAAYDEKHTHGNADTLNKIGESDGQPTFGGLPIKGEKGEPGEVGTDGADGKDALINGINTLEIIDSSTVSTELDSEAGTLKLHANGVGLVPQIIVATQVGATITCVNGEQEFELESTDGHVVFHIPAYGDWTVTAKLEGRTGLPETVTVDTVKQYYISVVVHYYYGYDLNLEDENPATRVSYPSDVGNAGFAPAAMNYDTGVFNYGDWNIAPGDLFMPRPCMLTYEGKVDHYLDPNDYTKKPDGSASRVADTSFGGNAMMEWPKIYTKRWEEGSIYKFRCCDIALDDDYECWCNYDRNNNQIDHFYTPIYFGSNVSGRMRSVSGQANLVSQNADTEISYAKANGNDWYTEVLADRLLIQDLLVMTSKTTEGQTAFGPGVVTPEDSPAIGQGTMNTKGLFWGSTNATEGVKVFGMENWWGNLWRRTAGWINDKGTQKVKITRGTKDGSSATDYNTTGNGYKNVSNATPTGTSGGYISNMKIGPYGRIPYNMSGSSSTYEGDGLYFNATQVNYAFVGGARNYNTLCGPFCAHLSGGASSSLISVNVGAALSCKPSRS